MSLGLETRRQFTLQLQVKYRGCFHWGWKLEQADYSTPWNVDDSIQFVQYDRRFVIWHSHYFQKLNQDQLCYTDLVFFLSGSRFSRPGITAAPAAAAAVIFRLFSNYSYNHRPPVCCQTQWTGKMLVTKLQRYKSRDSSL